jgi:hypothetical protein
MLWFLCGMNFLKYYEYNCVSSMREVRNVYKIVVSKHDGKR